MTRSQETSGRCPIHGAVSHADCHGCRPPPDTSVELNASIEDIDAVDVLGMLVWRMQNPGSIPPAFLCLSKEARGRNRQLAANTVETVRAEERQRQEARDAGNPRAFFCGGA